MALPRSFLDDVLARTTLSEVVRPHVRLTRRGREYLGLCPFHGEKTPSFTVNDAKGFYHCFGCGAHGNAFDFEMALGSLSFPEAVEKLATAAGLTMPRPDPESRARARRDQDLVAVCEAAAAWFRQQLPLAPGAAARHYLAERGVRPETVEAFGLGWAPESRGALRDALGREGFTEDALVTAGLLIRPEGEGRPYDRFRGRVIFPIHDPRGRVVAFGGRRLGDGPGPKYLNSPETPLFHKGTTLYGLSRARAGVRERARVVVVEGYMDVIALTQAGVTGAVAPLGTALTPEQMRLLWRLVPAPVLCFDGDAAGQRAAVRAAERALPELKPGLGLGFALLPPGEDPDSLVRTAGVAALEQRLQAARPLSDMLWHHLRDSHPLDTPEQRARLEAAIDETLAPLTDTTVRQHFRRDLRDRLFTLLRERRAPRAAPGRPRPPETARDGAPTSPRSRPHLRERVLLYALIQHPALAPAVEEPLMRLPLNDPALDKCREVLLNVLMECADLDPGAVRTHLATQGLSETVARLEAPEVRVGAGFAAPGQPLETVRAGWEHVFDLCQRQALDDDLRQATEALGNDLMATSGAPAARALALMRRLHEEEQRVYQDSPTRHDDSSPAS